jgi:predicted ATP-grasp superfamily ATP-dependent carboligase
LQHLIQIPGSLSKIPVLVLTTDDYVEFYIKNREVLEDKYLINMPDTKTVDLLLDKNKFSVFAKANNVLIPRSFEVRNERDLFNLQTEIKFPVILKPYLRTAKWEAAHFKKAYILSDFDKLQKTYERVSAVEKFFIIQEYIQGGDDHIEYCLTYFSDQGDCVMSFTGRKIRQWPVETGSTATTMPVENNWIKEETERIFKLLCFTGFGSIEFKRNDDDGKYYLIEPTAGRLNQQEYVATLSGYNIPLAAYRDLTRTNIQPKEKKLADIIYIDEIAEICSVCTHFKRKLITFPQWMKSLKGQRYYRFFNKKDIGVAYGLILNVMHKLVILCEMFLKDFLDKL